MISEKQSYNPQELVRVLLEMEDMLAHTLQHYCPTHPIIIGEDVEQVCEDFLKINHLKDDQIGYVSSNLALLHLKNEIVKAKNVVVDSNNMRAYVDFQQSKNVTEAKDTSTKTRVGHQLLYLMVFCALTVILVIYLFRNAIFML